MWDTKKATANHRQHGISFEIATLSATAHDSDHSEDEDRFVIFGISLQGRLLTVSHTDRGNSIRILSARLATNAERKIYEEG